MQHLKRRRRRKEKTKTKMSNYIIYIHTSHSEESSIVRLRGRSYCISMHVHSDLRGAYVCMRLQLVGERTCGVAVHLYVAQEWTTDETCTDGTDACIHIHARESMHAKKLSHVRMTPSLHARTQHARSVYIACCCFALYSQRRNKSSAPGLRQAVRPVRVLTTTCNVGSMHAYTSRTRMLIGTCMHAGRARDRGARHSDNND